MDKSAWADGGYLPGPATDRPRRQGRPALSRQLRTLLDRYVFERTHVTALFIGNVGNAHQNFFLGFGEGRVGYEAAARNGTYPGIDVELEGMVSKPAETENEILEIITRGQQFVAFFHDFA